MSDIARKIQGDNGNREANDFYPTPERATLELLKRINISGQQVWGCACGDGAISRLLPEGTISTDLINRGYGEHGIDFLKTQKKVDWIITNPPYSIATDFVIHALWCSSNVAMLLKIQFLEGVARYDFFKNNPPKQVFVFSKRLQIVKNGESMKNSTMMCFAWFVWEKGFKGSPSIDWIL